MTYEAAHSALRARFETQWASATDIAWPNVEFTPPDDDDWVRFVISDTGAFQASMGDPGNNIHRHTGVVTIMIFTRLGLGDEAGLEYADLATAIFRGWEDAATGLRFREPPFVRQVPGQAHKWYHINVLCPYERDSLL